MSNVANLNATMARIAAIAALADGVRNTAYRTLPRLTPLDLPMVFIVPTTSNDEIDSNQTGITVRTFELNVYCATVEQGKFAYQGLELAQDLIDSLRAVFDPNPRLELTALNDEPDWIINSVIVGDSGYAVLDFGAVRFGGFQMTLQVTSLKNVFNQLP